MQMTRQYQCRSRKGSWRIDGGIGKDVAQTAPQESHPQIVRTVFTCKIKQRHCDHHINKDHLAEEHNFTTWNAATKKLPQPGCSLPSSHIVIQRGIHLIFFNHGQQVVQPVYFSSAVCGIQELNELGQPYHLTKKSLWPLEVGRSFKMASMRKTSFSPTFWIFW